MISEYGLREHLGLVASGTSSPLSPLLFELVQKYFMIFTKLNLVIFNGLPEVVCVRIPVLQGVQMLQTVYCYLEDLTSLMQNLLMFVGGLFELFGRRDRNILKYLI